MSLGVDAATPVKGLYFALLGELAGTVLEEDGIGLPNRKYGLSVAVDVDADDETKPSLSDESLESFPWSDDFADAATLTFGAFFLLFKLEAFVESVII